MNDNLPESPSVLLRTSLVSLKAFEVVARRRSLAEAADELCVTPGAVSQQIKALEDRLGNPLFLRNKNKLVITEHGRFLAESLSLAFANIDQALRRVSTDPRKRTIRVAATPAFLHFWLIPRLSSFCDKYPDVEIQMLTIGRNSELDLAATDFGLYWGSNAPTDAREKFLFDDVLVPVCRPDVADQIRSPRDITKFKLLSAVPYPQWGRWLAAHNLTTQRYNEIKFANGALAIDAALAGLGIAIAQQAYTQAMVEAGRLVAPLPCLRQNRRAYYLVYRPAVAQTHLGRIYLEWLESVA